MSRVRTTILVGAVLTLAFVAGRPVMHAQRPAFSPKPLEEPVPAGVAIPQGQKYATTMSPNQEVPIPNGTPTGRGTGWVVLNAAARIEDGQQGRAGDIDQTRSPVTSKSACPSTAQDILIGEVAARSRKREHPPA